MTSRVDINVVLEDLLGNAKLQQMASREAFLDSVALGTVKKEAVAGKESKEASRGKRLDGAPLKKWSEPSGRFRWPELAANRRKVLSGFGVVVWKEEETYNGDGQLSSRTVTVRNASGTGEATFSYDLPTFPVPEDAWFPGGNGYSFVESGLLATGYTSTKRSEQFFVERDERKTSFCLPLSGGASLFVYRSRGGASWWQSRWETILETVPWVSGGPLDGLGYYYSTTFDKDFSSTVSEWEVTKCYVVTPSAVREVVAPTGLVDAIRQYEPAGYSLTHLPVGGLNGTYLPSGSATTIEPSEDFYLTWLPSREYLLEYGWASTYFQLLPEDRVEPYWQFSWGSGPVDPVTGLTAEYGYPSDFNWETYFAQPITVNRLTIDSEVPPFTDFRDSIPLLTCYGVGALASTSHSATGNASFYSPAMFTFLAEVDSSILDGYGDIYEYQDAMQETNAGYAYIKSTYLAGAPTSSTFYAPCALSGGCPVDSTDGVNYSNPADSYVRFDKAAVEPVSHDIALIVPDDFTPGEAPIRLVGLTGQESLVYSWDWGDASYCRSQLVALGFAENDLSA